jgi:hypothetical protein
MLAETTEQSARAPAARQTDWTTRRRRLERLADLLERRDEPVRLFTTMECYPRRERLALRQPGSPLALACRDPQFRREGLHGDRVGDAVVFFKLSLSEAHALLCDCRYGAFSLSGEPLAQRIARRARNLAAKRNFDEWRALLASGLATAASRLRRLPALGSPAAGRPDDGARLAP